MSKNNLQEEIWAGKFGKEYTKRNFLYTKEVDELYEKLFGLTRTGLNKEFVGGLDRSIKILEVGCNIGAQLVFFQKMGFKNLYGIETNKEAIEFSKAETKGINVIYGSALDLPFKDNYFDLVFTSGVLIHISPSNIGKAMKEIYRCSKKYIWGFEYYADKYTEIVYRGNKNILWKTNFPKLYKSYFKKLKLIKEKKIKYLGDENTDVMFLLKK